jgi:restriction system protein
MINEVPDFQSFFRPVLEVLNDEQTHRMRDLYDTVADHLEISPEARKEKIPSKRQLLYHNRIAWAKTYLKKAGLVEQPARGQVQITDVGKQVLREKEGRLDVKFLTQFSEDFARFHARIAMRTLGIRKSSPATKQVLPLTKKILRTFGWKSSTKALNVHWQRSY